MIANELCFDAEINDEDMEKLIDSSRHRSKLKLLREGSSRRVYKLNDEVLLTEFKDQVHSNKDGFIVVNGTSIERVRIYKILNDYLTKNGVPGSAIAFYDRCVAHRNLPVSENIEVIVKTREPLNNLVFGLQTISWHQSQENKPSIPLFLAI